jgi:uncharacterized protein
MGPDQGEEKPRNSWRFFDEAGTAFRDTLSLTIDDPLDSAEKDRFVLMGNSHKDRILVVVDTVRGDNSG